MVIWLGGGSRGQISKLGLLCVLGFGRGSVEIGPFHRVECSDQSFLRMLGSSLPVKCPCWESKQLDFLLNTAGV